MKAVIDTNVLLVANGQHKDVSPDCVDACVERLQAMQRSGVVVIDDGFHILGEYQHKTQLNPPKGVGDVFLKWLLREATRGSRVECIRLTSLPEECFAEFPDKVLESEFDPSDRPFVAVANGHPDKPEIWQAADCKWLDWWQALEACGLRVRFLCPEDACAFYRHKFPSRPEPALPVE